MRRIQFQHFLTFQNQNFVVAIYAQDIWVGDNKAFSLWAIFYLLSSVLYCQKHGSQIDAY